MRLLPTLRWSIAALGAVGAVAAMLVSAQAWSTQRQMDQAAQQAFVAKDVVADILPPPMYLIEMRLVLSQAVEGALDAASAAREMARLRKEYDARAAYWHAHPPYGLEQQLLGEQHAAAQRFIEAAQSRVMAPLAAGDTAAARAALPAVHQLFLAHRAGVDKTVLAGNAFAERSMDQFSARQQRANVIATGTTALAIALVLLLARVILGSIEGPLERCAGLARRIAGGDLSAGDAHASPRGDAIGVLEHTLQDMRAKLASLVTEVRRNADSVAVASHQIAVGNNDMSQRTERQAGALQQTSATMLSLSEAVGHSASYAEQADRLAQQASEVARQGGGVVGAAVTTMQGIHDSSRRIAEIIGVIDGIAFQTNILALNAAVEAARAGEQGRGFAVVASEVRSLAGRSADAAREIKSLIGTSVERVEGGAAQIDQAGSTMQQVVQAIERVSGIVHDITGTSGAQREDVSQISNALVQIDQATQHNAAMVEQVAAAAGSLREQSQRLVQAVSVFRTEAA